MESLSEQKMEIKRLSTPSEQLPDQEKIVSWIVELTGQPEASVQSRLREEFDSPGTNVARAFRETGLEPYVWNDGLARFYEQTDAFLYELVIWNRNKLKRLMRRWVAKHLANSEKRTLDLTEQSHIHLHAYDAVVCLDVLEHVPDPPAFVEVIASYLRPGGRLIVHAPFYMIHPSNPTHLKANRRYSGSLSLYKKYNLKLVDGEPGWNPIVLRKVGDASLARLGFTPKLLGLRLTGWYLALGRFSTLPFWWVDFYRRKRNQWFNE